MINAGTSASLATTLLKRIVRVRNKWLIAILTASVVLRVGAAFALGDQVVNLPGTFDQISYHNLALRVLGGHGFSFDEVWWPVTPAGAPTAHWSFLYTLYLVAVYAVVGPHPLAARLIQAVITGLLHPYLAFRIGSNVFSPVVGLVSAGLTALYTYFIYYGATLMTEPYFITLVMASLYLAMRLGRASAQEQEPLARRRVLAHSLLLGLTLGGAVLLRQLILLLIPFVFLWIWWARRGQRLLTTLSGLALASAMVAAMVLPFSIYNTLRFGRFVLLNTNSGYAFFWANHPVYGTRFQGILTTARYQDLIPQELADLDEAAMDQALLRRGLQFVLDDPSRYVQLSISRIPVYFMFWPSQDSGAVSNLARVASFGLLWPLMSYGLLLSVADLRRMPGDRFGSPTVSLVLFVVIYSLVHLLSWALIRYRLPVDAVALVFAGYAVCRLVRQPFWPRRARVPVR